MRKLAKIIATVFFAGYIPFAPGTIASALALFFIFILKDFGALYLVATAFFVTLGFWSAHLAEGEFDKKDPREIVIDEFSSMFIVYLFIPFTLTTAVIGFIIFRLLDIFKLPPVKKLQTLPKGWGIMLDDIAAAILTNLTLQVLIFCF